MRKLLNLIQKCDIPSFKIFKDMKNNVLYMLLIIISLVGISYIVFPTKWEVLLGKLKENETIIELKKENEELQKQNEEIKKQREQLKEQMKQDSIEIANLQNERAKIDKQLDKKDRDILKTKNKLEDVIEEQNDTKNKINQIKNSSNNKRGEELIFSISKRVK